MAYRYRLSVRRNSEKKLAESLKHLRDTDENWGNMFEEVYYPLQPVVRIKDKSLVIAFKAMAPGLVYIKTKMNPDLADDIESIKGVYAFLKNPNNLIVPLSKAEGDSIEVMRDRNTAVIDPELMLMKKDEYVSVVSGPRKGRYGILMGAKNGKLEVTLRQSNALSSSVAQFTILVVSSS
jgi:transcription antitermination factor NusG